MERKKINSIVVLLLIGILLPVSLFLFPIYAEAVAGDSPIIGVNIKYRDYDIDHEPYQLSASLEMPHRWLCVSSHSTMGCQAWSSQDTSGTIQDEITGYINVSSGSYTDILYEYEFVLDKSYVGYIDFSSVIGVTSYNRYYVNGTSFTVTSKQLITSFTVSRYSLEYAPLEVIDMVRQWNFPIESFNFIYMLMKNNVPIVDIFDDNYYNYPIFELTSGLDLTNGVNISADKFILIFGFSRYINKSTFTNFFTYPSSYELSDFIAMTPNTRIQFYKAIFNKTVAGNQAFTLSYNYNQTSQIVPIYFKRGYDELYNSTDFALIWGLSNQLLDDIHLIAQGTQQSQTSSGSLDQTTSQFSSDASDLVTIEETFNSSMNQSLQNVNPTFNMGSSFLASANWVSTQFNRIVNNTPFASLITFGLTLGLGLLIIGKVRK